MEQLQEGLQRLGYQFVPFLLAVVGHEFGHGLVARLWGDKTAEEAGRLTLNPIPHIDPIGTLVFPMLNMVTGMNVMFGWAKPVPIDPRRFRKFRPGLFCVALAGPMSNFILALLCAFLLCFLVKYVGPEVTFMKELKIMCEIGVYINFGLGFFNLIPLPPLDGSKIVESMLPYPAMQKYEKLGKYSFIILLALMFTGAIQFLNGPILFLGNFILALAAYATGVDLTALN
jgi:Zn-dependent protease